MLQFRYMASKALFLSNELTTRWKRVLGVSDARFRLVCSAEETVYFTRPDDALAIQREISKHLGTVSVFLDAFACVGGDSMAALYVHKEADVHAVQRAKSEEERARFIRLGQNLRAIRKSCSNRTGSVRWYDIDIGSFLMQTDLPEISVLYLDPPWAVGADPEKVSSNNEICRFLRQNVFRFLKRDVAPSLICLKLPHFVGNIEEWPNIETEYALVAHLHVRKKYHVYVLKA